MTEAEMNITIAEKVMGYEDAICDDYEFFARTPESAPRRTRLAMFTRDLNACKLMEDRIFSDRTVDLPYLYRNYLEHVVGFDFFDIISAPAPARVEAALKALQAVEADTKQ